MRIGVASESTRPRAVAAFLAVVVALAACSNPGTSPPPASPGRTPDASPAATASPVTGSLDHPTGADELVFRFAEGGGFVPMGFFATEAPLFSMYGDGTVIFRDGSPSPGGEGGVVRMPPFRIVQLSEEEVQRFLAYAIADGGLGVALPSYGGPGADLPTATFTLNAGGTTKSVSVMALGFEREPGADTPVLEALAKLGEKIRAFHREVDGETIWMPDRWRGVLTPDATAPPREWPWPDVSPSDFIQHPDQDAPRFPVRTMTQTEIDVLGLEDIDGGFSDLALTGPDEKVYLFALRPLLPDEAY